MASPPGLGAESEVGHVHRCENRHRWFHAGATVVTCMLPIEGVGAPDAPAVEAVACPICSGREDLLHRERHQHHCELCDATWRHEGRCVQEPVAGCPWCVPLPDDSMSTARRGSHLHACSRCRTRWRHGGPCEAPVVSDLVQCPACAERRRRRTLLVRGALAVVSVGGVLLPLVWTLNIVWTQRVTDMPSDRAAGLVSPTPSRTSRDAPATSDATSAGAPSQPRESGHIDPAPRVEPRAGPAEPKPTPRMGTPVDPAPRVPPAAPPIARTEASSVAPSVPPS